MTRKILSMVLTLALCLTLLPTAAWADDEDTTAPDPVPGGDGDVPSLDSGNVDSWPALLGAIGSSRRYPRGSGADPHELLREHRGVGNSRQTIKRGAPAGAPLLMVKRPSAVGPPRRTAKTVHRETAAEQLTGPIPGNTRTRGSGMSGGSLILFLRGVPKPRLILNKR